MGLGQVLGTIINGKIYDSSSVSIQITPSPVGGVIGKVAGAVAGALGAGQLFQGITKISFKDSLEPGIFRAIGSAEKLGMTRGEYDCECSFTMEKSWADSLLATLAAVNGGGYGEAHFQIDISYAEIGGSPLTATIEGCRIMSAEDSVEQGAEALMVDFEVACMRILRNGNAMLSDIAGAIGSLL